MKVEQHRVSPSSFWNSHAVFSEWKITIYNACRNSVGPAAVLESTMNRSGSQTAALHRCRKSLSLWYSSCCCFRPRDFSPTVCYGLWASLSPKLTVSWKSLPFIMLWFWKQQLLLFPNLCLSPGSVRLPISCLFDVKALVPFLLLTSAGLQLFR